MPEQYITDKAQVYPHRPGESWNAASVGDGPFFVSRDFDKGVVESAAAAPVGWFLGSQRVDRTCVSLSVAEATEGDRKSVV